MHVEWEKLLQISAVAAFCASTFGALGGSFAEALAVREAAEQYVQLATELLAVYRAMGYEPADFYAPFSRFREFEAATFDESVEQRDGARARHAQPQGFIGRPSLHDDLLRGKTTEIDYCVGAYLQKPTRTASTCRRSAARTGSSSRSSSGSESRAASPSNRSRPFPSPSPRVDGSRFDQEEERSGHAL